MSSFTASPARPDMSSFTTSSNQTPFSIKSKQGGLPKNQMMTLLFILLPIMIIMYGLLFAGAFMYLTKDNAAAPRLLSNAGADSPAASPSLRAVEPAKVSAEVAEPAKESSIVVEKKDTEETNPQDVAAEETAAKAEVEAAAKAAAEEVIKQYKEKLEEETAEKEPKLILPNLLEDAENPEEDSVKEATTTSDKDDVSGSTKKRSWSLQANALSLRGNTLKNGEAILGGAEKIAEDETLGFDHEYVDGFDTPKNYNDLLKIADVLTVETPDDSPDKGYDETQILKNYIDLMKKQKKDASLDDIETLMNYMDLMKTKKKTSTSEVTPDTQIDEVKVGEEKIGTLEIPIDEIKSPHDYIAMLRRRKGLKGVSSLKANKKAKKGKRNAKKGKAKMKGRAKMVVETPLALEDNEAVGVPEAPIETPLALEDKEAVEIPETPIKIQLSNDVHITKDLLALMGERKKIVPEGFAELERVQAIDPVDKDVHIAKDYITLLKESKEEAYQDLISPEDIVLPNVLLVGALKAGTTAIAEWLFANGVCHPEVMAGEPDYYAKEVQFFDQQSRYEQGLQFYAKRWQRCKDSIFAMDGTPNTLSFPSHVESIYKEAGGSHLRELKVIVVIREPVSREVSLYNHKVYEFFKTKDRTQWYADVSYDDGSIMPFHEHSENVIHNIESPGDWGLEWGLADTGLYAKHLRGWLKFLERKQILAISFDEFKNDNTIVETRISSFLGFDFPGSTPFRTTEDNEHLHKFPSCHAQEKLNKIFGPMNQDLFKILNNNPGPDAEQRPFPEFKQLSCVHIDVNDKKELEQDQDNISGHDREELAQEENKTSELNNKEFGQEEAKTAELDTTELKTGEGKTSEQNTTEFARNSTPSFLVELPYNPSPVLQVPKEDKDHAIDYESIVLPNVLLVGAQKAGTSSIGSWLYSNGICRPGLLEGEPDFYKHGVQFFDQQDRYEQGLAFYTQRYQHCNNSAFSMDATPNTLSFPEHVEAAYKHAGGDHLKKLKVIVVLREPVSRELSLYNHRVSEYLQTKDRNQWYSNVLKEDGSVMPFHNYTDIVIRDIKDPGEWGLEWGLADAGHYARHLEKWMKFTDRKNLLVLSYDEFKLNPRKVERRIRSFFGYEFPGQTEVANDRPFDNKVEHPECKTVTKLNGVFQPMNRELYKLLMKNPGPSAEGVPFPAFFEPECTKDVKS